MFAGIDLGRPVPTLERPVCVIDADEGVRGSLDALLNTLPVRVVTFSSAEEFLEHLEEGVPCLLIFDLSLPGMSGFELLDVLHSRHIHIPALGLTEGPDPVMEAEASRLGVMELLEKPFVYWAVVHRVQETLGLPS